MEEAHLAGMEGGTAAYNNAIGSALTGPPDCPACLRPRVAGHHGCSCDDDYPQDDDDNDEALAHYDRQWDKQEAAMIATYFANRLD
jgi:hypothetical protein